MSVRHISLAMILTTKVYILCPERLPDHPALNGVGKLLERLRFTFTAYGKRQTSVENFSE